MGVGGHDTVGQKVVRDREAERLRDSGVGWVISWRLTSSTVTVHILLLGSSTHLASWQRVPVCQATWVAMVVGGKTGGGGG